MGELRPPHVRAARVTCRRDGGARLLNAACGGTRLSPASPAPARDGASEPCGPSPGAAAGERGRPAASGPAGAGERGGGG